MHSLPPGVCLTRPPRLSTSVTPRSSVMLFLAAQWGRPLFSDLLSTQAGLHPNPRALCHPNQCTFLSLLGGCKHLVDRSPIGVRGGPQWPAQSLTRRAAFPGSPRWGSSLSSSATPTEPLGSPDFQSVSFMLVARTSPLGCEIRHPGQRQSHWLVNSPNWGHRGKVGDEGRRQGVVEFGTCVHGSFRCR